MAFSIELYNVSDDPRKLNKTLGEGLAVNNVRPTDIVDLMNPSFILDYNESYTTKNYLYASSPFDRYYFITDMKIDIGKKIVISCSADVLYTYREDIKEINTTIVRSEKFREAYLPDPEYKVKSGFQNYSYVWPLKPFVNTPKYVLNVMGGEHENQYLLLPDPQTPPTDWTTSWADYYILEDDDYISVGTLYGFSTAPPYDVVYTTHNGVYQRVW